MNNSVDSVKKFFSNLNLFGGGGGDNAVGIDIGSLPLKWLK